MLDYKTNGEVDIHLHLVYYCSSRAIPALIGRFIGVLREHACVVPFA